MMTVLIKCLVAMVATLGFSILFQAPKREYIFCALAAGVSYLAYSLLTLFGVGITLSSFIATFVLMLMSRGLSAIRRAPTIVFLFAGIFPLVPGAGIYYTAYYIFTGETAMAGAKALETFKIAGAIVLGILFGYALPPQLFRSLGKRPAK